jgi:uncharacterized protein with ParB-like and HNH nuclease domain
MKASETKLQKVIEGQLQYVIPLFQRAYSWDKKEWEVLWDDIVDLCEMENPRSHFIGSIVSMPTVSVPEGVAKYLLIDGQQRITTIFAILSVLRDRAREANQRNIADEINECYLVNKFKEGVDFYKLMPTQADRDSFAKIINGSELTIDSQIAKAYDFFKRKIKQKNIDTEVIKKIITAHFSIVSIVLDPDDNPYLVFESLNSKGRPLTPADLIRNYFFMRIHVNEQEAGYNKFWQPMQIAMSDNLTEYIRHFLMRQGAIVKQSDVYYTLKEKVTPENAIIYLDEMNKFSGYYQKLLNPNLYEQNEKIKKLLTRLNRFEVTTAYPLLLNCYNLVDSNKLSISEFADILLVLENYLVRRFVCGIPTNQLNKNFPSVLTQVFYQEDSNVVDRFKNALQSKGYPKDAEFKLRFKESKLYGAADRAVKTKLILESIEEQYAHKEIVDLAGLTIEHILPQTITDWWKDHLGSDWEDVHDLYLHTIGNLTLTAYNSEMSNFDYSTKSEVLKESHLEINQHFSNITTWKKENIEERSDALAEIALKIWPYFGNENSSDEILGKVTGTTPVSVQILGQDFDVKSWRDVMERTLNTISELEPDKFEIISQTYPRFVGNDKSRFRETRQLQNGYFIEVNIAAKDIQKICSQAVDAIELTNEDWKVTLS